ncbi:hypothetical protein NSK_003129 [Nannochloropsis salina CCMP1776]|uniref:Uncharacterized protein n=1 Tax=Nannochloropsis salina CCMP1776 TaxID=1027361 RepID=A0A4D9D2F8_9STRA|nr:hypothetical protein NSK_003129 [Nannochloropsis salina CCMP1776]|eukprot:TFJ85620.1 hypothetical protein NSK_003129 [Nannochloropsis salina CCMP1776]
MSPSPSPPLSSKTLQFPPPAPTLDATSSLPLALFLSTLSGVATVLGAVIVCMQSNGMTNRSLGLSQGMAAGFMIAVTILEIFPDAVDGVSVWHCTILSCVGAVLIFLMKHLLPEPDLSVFLRQGDDENGSNGGKASGCHGSSVEMPIVEESDGRRHRDNNSSTNGPRASGRCGGNEETSTHGHVRRAASVDEEEKGLLSSHWGRREGRSGAEWKPVSPPSTPSSPLERRERNRLLWSGLLTAATLAAHNFPEGVATFAASLQGLQVGLPLTVAIAFHNIPEGAACAIPIYVATQSRHKALLVALLSGMVEPCAVLLVASLGPASLTPAAVASLLAGVGGIMLGLSVFELVPQAVELTSGKEASVAVGMGFVIMAAVLGMARM